jgi:hypothetical protein
MYSADQHRTPLQGSKGVPFFYQLANKQFFLYISYLLARSLFFVSCSMLLITNNLLSLASSLLSSKLLGCGSYLAAKSGKLNLQNLSFAGFCKFDRQIQFNYC